MARLPFTVFRRKGRKFFYVHFKSQNGDYLPAVSTKQTSEEAAIEISFRWLREGKPAKEGNISLNVREALRDVETSEEAEFICNELKRLGLLKNFIVADSTQSVDFNVFLREFWNFDASPYVKEKLRKKHGIHRNYTISQGHAINRYWAPFFEGRSLGEITRRDIDRFMDDLATKKALTKSPDSEEDRLLSSGRKNRIMKAGVIPLRWAFAKEMIDKDITTKLTFFSEDTTERQIVTPEIAQAMFRVQWIDERARLANLLAAVTGLRSGEIRALRVRDLGKDNLYIRHSWNPKDKLKSTKNNEDRTVEVPFASIMNGLLFLASCNPHGATMDSYVFWADRKSTKPVEGTLFLEGLRDALETIGMSYDSAREYDFHGWRHFFTSYMMDKLNDKLLQSQTGHKSVAMLKHYGEHELVGEREKIRQAQMEVFGALVPGQRAMLPAQG